MTNDKPIIIIGSGQAGVSFIREFRKIDKEYPLTLICQDAGGFYSKPMLSNAFVKNMPLTRLHIQDAQTLAEKTNTNVLGFTQVTNINPENHTIEITPPDSNTPQTLEYAKLILALGAKPIKAPIPGLDQAISINHLTDYQKLRALLDTENSAPKSVAIIGGGLVGCELANDLHIGGHKVSLIEQEHQLLPRLASQAIAQGLRQQFDELGIQTFTGVSVQSIQADNQAGFMIETNATTNTHIPAQIVISALGLAPNTTLAQKAGLEINRGIVCNRQLQTSNQNIFGLGDCIEVEGQVLPYILPIMEGAKALAATLTGNPTQLTYPCMPIAVKTSSYPLVIAPAFTRATENVKTTESTIENGLQTLYYVEEQLVGFCLAQDAATQRQTLANQCRGVFVDP